MLWLCRLVSTLTTIRIWTAVSFKDLSEFIQPAWSRSHICEKLFMEKDAAYRSRALRQSADLCMPCLG